MPKDPLEEMVPTTPEDPLVAEILRKFSAALDEFVKFGLQVHKSCGEAARGTDENVALFMLLRHALELIDSVSRNVEVGLADPCRLLLRGLLECIFGIRYILQEDTNRRSMAFLVYHVHERLKWNRMLDPSTDEGKRYRRAIEKDAVLSQSLTRPRPDPEQRIEQLSAVLRKPVYLEAEREYQKQKPWHWYTLFGGPQTVEALASQVKLPAFYELFYRPWSAAVHGTDVIVGKILPGTNGKPAISQIRNPRDAQSWTHFALLMGIAVLHDFMEHFIPQRMGELKAWYNSKMKRTLEWLSGPPIIAIEG